MFYCRHQLLGETNLFKVFAGNSKQVPIGFVSTPLAIKKLAFSVWGQSINWECPHRADRAEWVISKIIKRRDRSVYDCESRRCRLAAPLADTGASQSVYLPSLQSTSTCHPPPPSPLAVWSKHSQWFLLSNSMLERRRFISNTMRVDDVGYLNSPSRRERKRKLPVRILPFLSRVSTALLTRDIDRVILSVRPSVCLSRSGSPFSPVGLLNISAKFQRVPPYGVLIQESDFLSNRTRSGRLGRRANKLLCAACFRLF